MEQLYAYFEKVQDLIKRCVQCHIDHFSKSLVKGGRQQLMSKVVAEKNLAEYVFEKYGRDLPTLKQVLG